MIEFNKEQIKKYSESQISGTGYLAFRDILQFCELHKVNTTKVLDLGCGAGRSTKFLSDFCENVVGVDISNDMLKIAQKRE